MALREAETIGFKPLYAQVRDHLVRQLVDGSWTPGMLIPSEMALARQLNVSQGTVRKALDAMAADNLLVRRQGRGTFVAEPDDARILFQFFHLTPDDAPPSFPQSTVLDSQAGEATREEADALHVARGAPVWRIERLRRLDGKPVLIETIVLSATRFRDFPDMADIPNNIYQLFLTRWGVTVAQAQERLKAVAASEADAGHLQCRPGSPLLSIHRIARDLEGNAVELRLSRCLTGDVHYGVTLR